MFIKISAGYNNGYSAEQVADESITVQSLIEQLQELVENGDLDGTERVFIQTPGRYGANFYSVKGASTAHGEDEEGEDEGYEDGDDPHAYGYRF